MFAGGDTILCFELSAKIIYRVESAEIADFFNCIDFFSKHFICDLEFVLDQELDGRTIHKRIETASGFAAAHICCLSKIFQRNLFLIMSINKIKHFLQPDLIDKLDPI